MRAIHLSGDMTIGVEVAGTLTVAATAVALADEVASYPEWVQETVVTAARALLELFTSDAIVSMWSLTDPRGRVFLTVVLAVLIDQAWRAASPKP